MERTNGNADERETFLLNERLPRLPRRSYDDSTEALQGVHLATRAEKKRIWWRTAIINAIFILSW